MAYLLDTNIFIRSKNDMPMDLWPTFWSKFKEMSNSGAVFTSMAVKEEIERGEDELKEWIKREPLRDFFIPLDPVIMQKYSEVQAWARSTTRYTEVALNTFASVADAYLVATAAARSMVLVTYERSDLNCRRRVLLPDVCNALDISYCDLNAMLRELKITI